MRPTPIGPLLPFPAELFRYQRHLGRINDPRLGEVPETVEHHECRVEGDVALGDQRGQPPRRRTVAVRFRQTAVPFPPPDGGSLLVKERHRRLPFRWHEVEVGRGGVFEPGDTRGDCLRGTGRAQVAGGRETVFAGDANDRGDQRGADADVDLGGDGAGRRHRGHRRRHVFGALDGTGDPIPDDRRGIKERPAEEESRPRECPVREPVPKRDQLLQVTAGVAYRRHPEARVERRHLFRQVTDVDVAVDKPRHNRQTAGVERLGVRLLAELGVGSDRRDPIALDQHARTRPRRRAGAVDDGGAADEPRPRPRGQPPRSSPPSLKRASRKARIFGQASARASAEAFGFPP